MDAAVYFGFAMILLCAGLALLVVAGRSGKLDRSRALPKGTVRMRSREEILHELRLGQVALDQAEREAAMGMARLYEERERAGKALASACASLELEGVGHA